MAKSSPRRAVRVACDIIGIMAGSGRHQGPVGPSCQRAADAADEDSSEAEPCKCSIFKGRASEPPPSVVWEMIGSLLSATCVFRLDEFSKRSRTTAELVPMLVQLLKGRCLSVVNELSSSVGLEQLQLGHEGIFFQMLVDSFTKI